MASLADILKNSRRPEMEHAGRPTIDTGKARGRVTKLARDADALAGSLASVLPRMDEGGGLGYDEDGNLLGGYDPAAQAEKAVSFLMPVGTAAEVKEGAKGLAHGVLKTFGGIGAKTADREALAAAEALEKAGAGMRDIHRETGWFRAPWDGKWRWEIDDGAAGFRDTYHEGVGRSNLGNQFDHPDFYGAYPGAKKDKIKIDKARTGYAQNGKLAYGASFDPNAKIQFDVPAFPYGGERQVASQLLHELQHRTQFREGFAIGGGPELFPSAQDTKFALFEPQLKLDRLRSAGLPTDDVEAEIKSIQSLADYADAARRKVGDMSPVDLYRRLAGEAEARLVQDRMNLTPQQRREQYPLDSLAAMLRREGIDPGADFENLIVRYGE